MCQVCHIHIKNKSNELLDCIHDIFQKSIIDDIHHQSEVSCSYCGIQADEVSHASNTEKLGIILRYLKDGKPVEKLVEFVVCESITGSVICDKIISFLSNFNLSPSVCRTQTYDEAGNI